MKILLAYLIAVNAVSVILCIKDKISAKKRGKRIRERTLFLFSIIGGSIGMYMAMLVAKHKTKHIKFILGIPVIIIIQAVFCCLLYTYC